MGSAAEAGVVNEIRRFELFTDGRSAQVALGRPDLVIERSRLIRALADDAQQAGAMLACNTRFLTLAPNSSRPRSNGGELRLEVESGGRREELHAANVVGADGVSSRVARTAGWPPLETVPLVQAIVRLPKDCPTDTVRVWFVPDDTPYFYWLIPESEERGALGLIAEDGRDAARRLARFLEKRRMEPIAWQGARIPAYRRWIPVRRRVGRGDVYLVGDAAAQVKVTTIGGVITGFRGARGVAEMPLVPFTPAVATNDPAVRYGFGWRISEHRGRRMLWHSGETAGFRNVIVRFPDERLTVVVLTNRDDPEPYRAALEIAEMFRSAAAKPPL